MSETIQKQADNFISRYGQDIADYLASKDTDLTPALAGAVLGGGAGALFTAEKPGETSKQRTMRTIRNAILTGTLGGIGGQSAAYGLNRMIKAIAGDPGSQASDGSERSLLRSPAAHLGSGLLSWAGLKNLQERNERHHLKNIFGSPKTQAEADTILDKLVVGSKRVQGTGFNPQSSWQDVEKAMPKATLDAGKNGPSGADLSRFFRSKMETLQHPFLEEGGKRRSTLNSVAQYVRDKSNLQGGPETVFGEKALSGTPENAKATMRNIKSWLRTHGVGGLTREEKTLQWLDRNVLANPMARSTSRFGRAAGRAVGPAGLAAGFFAPDILSAVSHAIADTGDSGILTPGIPNMGPTAPEEPGILEKLLTRSMF